MQGDEAFLSTLSVSAGNLDDIEGTLPGQVGFNFKTSLGLVLD